jgi:hypothetical protein
MFGGPDLDPAGGHALLDVHGQKILSETGP